jgi:hypothetical protein
MVPWLYKTFFCKLSQIFIFFHRPHHLIIKKIKIKIEQKEKVDIKWNQWARGKAAGQKILGTAGARGLRRRC